MTRSDDIAKTLGFEPGGQIGARPILFPMLNGILGPIIGEPASRGKQNNDNNENNSGY